MRYEVAAAAANIIGTEQPCRVRLRLWHCSADDPTASLEVPSLTIPDAVLCSEMGVHFSACGRFLAACVACQVCSCLAEDGLFSSLRLFVPALLIWLVQQLICVLGTPPGCAPLACVAAHSDYMTRHSSPPP